MKKNAILLMTVFLVLLVVGCGIKEEKKEKENKEAKKFDVLSVLEWEHDSGGIKLTSYVGTEKKIEVPEVIEGKRVVSIGEAFSGNVYLEELILPESVESVASAHLRGCTALKVLKAPGVKNHADFCGYSEGLPESLKELYLSNLSGTYHTPSHLKLDVLYIPKVTWLQPSVNAKDVTISEKINGYMDLTDFDGSGEVLYYDEDRSTGKMWIVFDEDKQVEASLEEKKAIYCKFFQNESVTVNGVKYEK